MISSSNYRNVLYKAFFTGSTGDVDAKLKELGDAFDQGGAEIRGEVASEVANVFEHFCLSPWSSSRALAVLRGAGRVIGHERLAFGIERAACNGNEEIMREALALIAPPERAAALRAAVGSARNAPSRGFAALVEQWAQALEDQSALESLPAIAKEGASERSKPRL